jgi:hypothetical protein
MDISISREEIKEYEKLKVISELALTKQRILLFESKYNLQFEIFEKKIKEKSKEEFAEWDDYIEWKAYKEKEIHLKEKMDQIANAQDIKITENT